MTGSPGAQDVADALAITLEREDASGVAWCPPADGAALRRWVTDRSASLGAGIRRAVRLVRVFALADGRDYVRFLYVRLTVLRTAQFRHALQRAAAEGRIGSGVAALSEMGVRLVEPALLARDGGPFEIDFAQMPRLAALIDFLHNALGFAAVADLLAPLLRPQAAASADEVARALHAALNQWLGERLESATHLRQAQHIRRFLAARGKLAAHLIDDETILVFWDEMAAAPARERIDGFRLFRSAAAALLSYRQALRDAAVGRHLELALGRDFDGREPANDEAGALAVEPWQSPLGALGSSRAARVKWLTAKEQHLLLNYLGAPADEAAEDAQADEAEPAGPWSPGLAGPERFDLAFRLTLLRADVFGAAQASIVARLRKRAAAQAAIAQALVEVDQAAYATAAAAYAQLRDQLRLECLAALVVLMEAGLPEAAILLDHLGGREVVAAVIGGAAPADLQDGQDTMDPGRGAMIAAKLRAAIAEPASAPAAEKLLREALAATRKVSRMGFRREDRADAAMQQALAAGAAAAVEVARELDRLIAALSPPPGDAAADRGRFIAGFERIYLS